MKLTQEQLEEIYKGVTFGDNVTVENGAHIGSNVTIGSGARIGRERKNVGENIVINGIGQTKNITAFVCDDGLIVCIGCANNYRGLPINEMRELIAKKYDQNHEYFDAMNLIEKWYKNLSNKGE